MLERTVRWSGVAAIVFVVLILISVFVSGQPPAADDSVEKIRTFLADHRSALLIANLLGLIGIPLVLWFGVVLREVLRGDRTANALGTASLAGLLVTAPLAIVGGGLISGAVYVDGVADNLGDDSVRILYEAQSLLFAATSAGLVLFSLTAGLAIYRTKALPAYTMWLAYLVTVANILTMFSTVAAGAAVLGLAGVISFALFVLVTGITMAAGKVAPVAEIRPALL
jgi:hypothetical protein